MIFRFSRTRRLPRPSRRACVQLGLLFAIAFVVYLLIWPQAPLLAKDSPSYMQLAHDIRHLQLSHFSTRTPGLPLLLILTGSTEHATRAFYYVSLWLHFFSIALILYIFFVIEVRRVFAIILCALALLPPFVEPAAYVLSENLSEFTIVLTFVLLILWLYTGRTTLLVAFSGSAAFAALVRPTFQLVSIPIAIVILLAYLDFALPRVRVVRLAGSILLSFSIPCGVLLGWAALNYFRFGIFGISSQASYTMSMKTVTTLENLPDSDAGLRSILIRYRDQNLTKPFSDHSGKDYIYRAMPEVRRYLGSDEVTAARMLQSKYWYLVRTKPLSYLYECLRSVGIYWMPNDYELSNGGSTALRYTWFALQIPILGFFFVQELTICGLLLFYTSVRIFAPARDGFVGYRDAMLASAHLAGTAIIFYCAFISCFFSTGESRYRQPTDLILIATTLTGAALWIRLAKAIVSQSSCISQVDSAETKRIGVAMSRDTAGSSARATSMRIN